MFGQPISPEFLLVGWSAILNSNSKLRFHSYPGNCYDYALAIPKNCIKNFSSCFWTQNFLGLKSQSVSIPSIGVLFLCRRNIPKLHPWWQHCLIHLHVFQTKNRANVMLLHLHASDQHLDIWGSVWQKFVSHPNRPELYNGRVYMKYLVYQIYVSDQFDDLRKSCREMNLN